MVVSKEDAVQALADIGATRARTETLRGYRKFGPQAMIWGSVWMLANALIELTGRHANLIWLVLILLGIAASMIVGARLHSGVASGERPRAGQHWRWAASSLLLALFFTATFAVLPPGSGAQVSAFISLFFAVAYTLLGVWGGWKILALGLIMAGLVLVGYFSGSVHFQLSSQALAGAAMVLGGWWMRRA
jgi:hypothetical protein